jgi:polysaccharide pyruvyl transferase WcaK-like protein
MSYRKSVLICNASRLTPDGTFVSVGDEAIAEWMKRAIRKRFPEVDVRATLDLAGNSKAALPLDRISTEPRDLFLGISQSDVVILGGGTLLQNLADVPRFPVSGLLRFVSFVCAVAKLTRVPVVIAGVGAESLDGWRARLATRMSIRGARAVSARDTESARLLATVSGRVPTVGADVMFLDCGDLPMGQPVTDSGPICISLRADAPPQLIDDLAAALQINSRKNAEVVLIAMDRRQTDDTMALRRLANHPGLTMRIREVARDATWQEIYEIIGQAQLCIGMRLHFLIFAVLSNRKTVALTSSPKSVSFASSAGLSQSPTDGDRDQLQLAIKHATAPSETKTAELSVLADRILEPMEMLLP